MATTETIKQRIVHTIQAIQPDDDVKKEKLKVEVADILGNLFIVWNRKKLRTEFHSSITGLAINYNPDNSNNDSIAEAFLAKFKETVSQQKLQADTKQQFVSMADVEDYSSSYSSSISQHTRQLSLTGFVICWFFFYNKDKNDVITYDASWLLPMVFFVLAVLVDYLHTSVGYQKFRSIQRNYWRSRIETDKPENILAEIKPRGILFFFYTKVVLTFLGYALLAIKILVESKVLNWTLPFGI